MFPQWSYSPPWTLVASRGACLRCGFFSGGGDGRLPVSVGRVPRLRLNSFPLPAAGTVEAPSLPVLPARPDRYTLAKGALVPSSPSHVVGLASAPSSSAGPSTSGRHRRRPSRSAGSCSCRLVSRGRKFSEEGLSHVVPSGPARSFRPSTERLYQARWRVLRDWCRARDLSAFSPLCRVLLFSFFTFGLSSVCLCHRSKGALVCHRLCPVPGGLQLLSPCFTVYCTCM